MIGRSILVGKKEVMVESKIRGKRRHDEEEGVSIASKLTAVRITVFSYTLNQHCTNNFVLFPFTVNMILYISSA